jgi:Tfp pilus assembly protein PilO
MSETIYLLTICLPLATILIVFGMKYFSAMRQAKARYENDEAYRQLADKAAAAQAETAIALAAINTTLADLKSRVMAVEKVLKEVE